MNLWLFFWLFLKASLFTTGGLGNLPLLHRDLLGLGWASEEDFLTALAVGQVSPGPTGLWSISLGFLVGGWAGAVAAAVALSIPPLLVLVLAAFYHRLEHLQIVQDFSRGLSLGVVGLAAAVSLGLAGSAISDGYGAVIALVALGLALTKRVPVILILGAAAVAGVLLYGGG
ncbi:MAG TPA: chromate transporter [Anaerolinea thermolimosa]|uniref:Chromate transporter n=1 Tax=Anaerolinea thermolimosa TaxID=229919 RepID=A0A3D1JEE8_9CHLR|nr:chromate transporter [Anaerolinea thermolimosa]GAP07321.1 chromate transport protein ChrA [Anaerolinea thermolimosa]HCE16882.1 chromate transporter [Anaerolinea thermolimosa]